MRCVVFAYSFHYSGVAAMHRFKPVPLAAALGTLFLSASVLADANPQPLPFAQDWSNTSLITANDDWSGV
ncbi:MAG: hypothetical protein IV089_11995, partial [Thiobacillus sp.]|nr:hypothetical protein [Thiobacillus sp.]